MSLTTLRYHDARALLQACDPGDLVWSLAKAAFAGPHPSGLPMEAILLADDHTVISIISMHYQEGSAKPVVLRHWEWPTQRGPEHCRMVIVDANGQWANTLTMPGSGESRSPNQQTLRHPQLGLERLAVPPQ